MTALTVESAKNLGIVVAAVLIALMLAMAWLVKNVTAKIISVVLIGGLAFGVWTQRTSLQDCANRVRERVAVGDTTDVTCTFLGTDIKVSG
ncbi:MAG TPA: hypothetical protein VLD86_15460 [Ilumatobacteraceae bacterium]|nr:hypothetical protein [Ilumatobacteraceae bacterium]